MSKFKPYSRRRFNKQLRDWAGKNWKVLVVLTLGAIASIALATVVIVGFFPHGPFMWWALGGIQGGVAAAYLLLAQASFFAHDREALNQLRGAWGEDNTRYELQRARRKRHVWDWVDSIQLQGTDIDHLVITRRGGLIAIDSKWRSTGYDIAGMAKSARRASTLAEAVIRSVLDRQSRVRHRAVVNALTVTPLVVVWGPEQHKVPAGYIAEGVEFVGGRHLVTWLAACDAEVVTKPAARDLKSRLENYRAGSWERNARV